MPAKLPFEQAPGSADATQPANAEEVDFRTVDQALGRSTTTAEQEMAEELVPVQVAEQQYNQILDNIREEENRKLYELRHLGITPEEEETVKQGLKMQSERKQMEAEQMYNATVQTMQQYDQLAQQGEMSPHQAKKLKYGAVGLQLPREQQVDPIKMYKELDSYRKALEKRLRPYAMRKGYKGSWVYGFPGGKKRAGQTEKLMVRQKPPGADEYQARAATVDEVKEYGALLEELSVVRSKMVEMLNNNNIVDDKTAQNLKGANRMQRALLKSRSGVQGGRSTPMPSTVEAKEPSQEDINNILGLLPEGLTREQKAVTVKKILKAQGYEI